MTRRDFPAKRLYVMLGLLAAVIVFFAGVVTSPVAAAAPAPAWLIESVANPTAFSSNDTTNPPAGECGAPCDKYQLRLTNVGGAATDGGPITITDTLPTGVTTSQRRSGNGEEEWECEPNEEGQSSIKCIDAAPKVSALSEAPSLTVYVQVEPGVPADSVRPNVARVEGEGAVTVEEKTPTLLNPSGPLPFEFGDFGSYIAEVAGAPDTQAAAHPNSLRTSLDLVSAVNRADGGRAKPTRSVQDVKDAVVDLPVGFVGNPQAAQLCPLQELVTGATSSDCPQASQVGRISFNANGTYDGEFVQDGRQNIPIYNMVAEPNHPAEFGFIFAEKPLFMYASVVGSGASTHVRVSIPGIAASQLLSFQGAVVTFFGDPADPGGLPSSPVAFFTNPSECSGKPLETTIHVDSWQNPGARNPDGTPDFSEPAGSAWKSDKAEMPAMEGCGGLHFNPTVSSTPDLAQAGAPTGLSVDLEVPQSSDPSIPATPDLKRVVVTCRRAWCSRRRRRTVSALARLCRSALKPMIRRRVLNRRKSGQSGSGPHCWQKNWKAPCIWRNQNAVERASPHATTPMPKGRAGY